MKLSKRLLAVASYLRGVALYDVGTDHAYLPIYAVEKLGVPYAEASDILPGPLKTAENNIRDKGLERKIKTFLRDGLGETALPDVCDIVIAGMGGEMISGIISQCPALRSPRVRLILQPMTKPDVLRRFLAENGYEIVHELIVIDKKPYAVIAAEYSGTVKTLSPVEAMIGDPGKHDDKESLGIYAERCIERIEEAAEGKKLAGIDTKPESEMIEQLRMK